MRQQFVLFLLLLAGFCSNAQCPVIEGAMVNSCNSGGSSEGPNEFLIFKTTAAAPAGNYTLYYGTSSNPRTNAQSIMAGSSASNKTGSGSFVGTSCTIVYVTKPTTVIPANSRVIFIPADFGQVYDVSAICNGGTLYIVFINRNHIDTYWYTTGNFGNSPSTPRYLQVVNGTNYCASGTVYYENNWAVDPLNPLLSLDGNFVSWDVNGDPTYSNDGCSVIPPISPVVITPNTSITVCKGKITASVPYTSSGSPDRYSITWDAAGQNQGFVNITNTALPPSPLNISVPVAAIPGSYVATVVATNTQNGVVSAPTHFTLTINPPPVNVANVSICSSQLPYMWQGMLLTSAGTYSQTVSSGPATCETTETINLSVKAASTSYTTVIICANQLPYSWNGTAYGTAGTYTKTLVNAGGCDSIATLNLSLKPALTSITNIAVCANELPYTWNGTAYIATGTYPKTLAGADGCDSVATLNLSIKPSSASATNISICANQLPYTWNGTLYNAAGSYTKTFVNAAGCDSVATLNLAVKQASSSNTAVVVCPSQLPYNWNGIACNNAGLYTNTLLNAAGCDSIATLQLTVSPTLSSVTNVSICTSQLPYSWSGASYTAAGTYSKAFTGIGGCDSVATLNLAVAASVTSSKTVIVCFGQLPYNWNGTAYTAAGIYNKTLVSTGGCDSIATLTLQVKQPTTSTSTVSVCSNQLPYLWNGSSYSAAGTYNKTMLNAAGCDSIATLILQVKQPTTSTTTIYVCSNQLPYTWNGSTYSAAGTYNKTLVNAAGCDSIATLILQVKQPTTSMITASVCSNQLPYIWNGSTYSAAGTYNKTLVNAAGCDSVTTLILQVKQPTTSTSTVSVCSNQLPYTWNGSTYSAAGTYKKTIVNAAGCDSMATLILIVKKSTSDTTRLNVCTPQLPVKWNGTSYSTAGTYQKQFMNAAGCDSVAVLILSLNAPTVSLSTVSICADQLPFTWNGLRYSQAGTYNKQLISINGCDSVATLSLLVKPAPPTPLITANTPLCTGDNLLLMANGSTGATYIWKTPGNRTLTMQNPAVNNVTAATQGRYTVTTLVNGCSSTAFIDVVVRQTPVLRTPSSPLQIQLGDTGTFKPNVTGSNLTFKWSPAVNFVSADTAKNARVIGVKDMSYLLMATADSICTTSASFAVKVLPRSKPVTIPNAFSPNGDGVNDTWVIPELAYYPGAEISVFNRYGQNVFAAKGGYRTPWNGANAGKALPVGTYYYVIYTNSTNKPLTGWVAILK